MRAIKILAISLPSAAGVAFVLSDYKFDGMFLLGFGILQFGFGIAGCFFDFASMCNENAKMFRPKGQVSTEGNGT